MHQKKRSKINDYSVGKKNIKMKHTKKHKRIIRIILSLALSAGMLFSCTEGEKNTMETGNGEKETSSSLNSAHSYEKSEENIALTDMPFEGVFKIGMPEGVADVNARFVRLENGTAYMVRGENGHVSGYFDLEKMILSENIISKKDSLSADSLRMFETERSNAVSIFDKSVFISSLAQGSFQSFEIPSKVFETGADLSNALLRDDSAFIYENEQLIMTALIDFETQYVLCRKTKLEDYGELLGIDKTGNKIYYAMKKEGSSKFTGYAYFEYDDCASSEKADKISENAVSLEFDEYTAICENVVLLKNTTERSHEFTFLDLNTGNTSELSIPASVAVYGYTCDKKGNYLFVYTAPSSVMLGGEFYIYDMEKDTRVKIIELEEYKTNKNISLDPTDTRLIFSRLSSDEDGEKGELICFYDVRSLWK